MSGKTYYGYPSWVDSPHARHVYDQQQHSRQQSRNQSDRDQAVTREWIRAKGKSKLIPVEPGKPGRKHSGGFLAGLVKIVFWAFVIGAILHSAPLG